MVSSHIDVPDDVKDPLAKYSVGSVAIKVVE
jgi:hypothetical protein